MSILKVPILFQKSVDNNRLHIKAYHGEKFNPPFVENWLTEALIVSTARVVRPRMVIRHSSETALLFIKATPRNTLSGMPAPFLWQFSNTEAFWQMFSSYLSKCKSEQQFEILELTQGFCELCLASKGTLQGFLISISLYIEFCVNQIFSSKNCGEQFKKNVDNLIEFVGTWECDSDIRIRAQKILTMLNNPSINERLNVLIDKAVIDNIHKKIWNKARPFLAHGNVIDFKKEDEFWQYRNYLIPMVYRLMFRIIGYKGIVLDYDGRQFRHVDYKWVD